MLKWRVQHRLYGEKRWTILISACDYKYAVKYVLRMRGLTSNDMRLVYLPTMKVIPAELL